MWQWLICLTYDSLHVLHVSVNSTHFCSCILLVVLDLLRCCVVLLKDIPTFISLSRISFKSTNTIQHLTKPNTWMFETYRRHYN